MAYSENIYPKGTLMHIMTLEGAIDHFANEFDIDHIHTSIHRTLDARTGSPSDQLPG